MKDKNGTEENRKLEAFLYPFLSCIHLTAQSSIIFLYTCNTHILSKQGVPIPAILTNNQNVVFPIPAIPTNRLNVLFPTPAVTRKVTF